MIDSYIATADITDSSPIYMQQLTVLQISLDQSRPLISLDCQPLFQKRNAQKWIELAKESSIFVTSSAKRGLIADPNSIYLEFHNLTCEFTTTLKLGPNIPLTCHYCVVQDERDSLRRYKSPKLRIWKSYKTPFRRAGHICELQLPFYKPHKTTMGEEIDEAV